MSKKGNFEKKKKSKFDHSLVFMFSSLKKIYIFKIYDNNISLPWALAFFLFRAPLLPLPPQNLLDNVSG
jgi:hypothetical protein